jgi:acetyl-CoA carboxylase beta subunit
MGLRKLGITFILLHLCLEQKMQIEKPLLETDTKLQIYFCPHCNKKIMTGSIRRLHMVCPNCQKMVKADAADLLSSQE